MRAGALWGRQGACWDLCSLLHGHVGLLPTSRLGSAEASAVSTRGNPDYAPPAAWLCRNPRTGDLCPGKLSRNAWDSGQVSVSKVHATWHD